MVNYLPDWVNEGKETRDFLEWLECGSESMGRFSGWFLVKGALEGCVLIYTAGYQGNEEPGRFRLMQLCGIFRKEDCTLYEVSPVLYQAVGIPEEFGFPDKKDVQADMEEKVTARGRELMQKGWDELVIQSGCTKEQLIPVINREQIRQAARRYFHMKKRAADINYQPQFSFEVLKSEFSDETFLQYLNNETLAVETMAKSWMCKTLPDISKKRIYYGCVREEMAEMEKVSHSRGRNGRASLHAPNTEKKSA